MEPSCMKMTLLVFIAVFSMRARSQTEHRIGSDSTSETERCVCQPHITVNPPVCRRAVPVNSGASCNCTTVQEVLRKVDDLQFAVSTNQAMVTTDLSNTTHQLKETRLQVEELRVNVSTEIQGLKQQLDELHVLVSSLVEFHHAAFPKDCSEILASGTSTSGVYTVQPLCSRRFFHVFCDMKTDGGGWTVFQRRQDGSVDFYRSFANYSQGFGNLEGEFWLGNDNLHRLTAQGEYELRVDLWDFENNTAFAVYDSFSIAGVSDKYRLSLGNYSGTAGDSLSHHNNFKFTTKDQDNDEYRDNCAQLYHGAWWYTGCRHSHLNGVYLRGHTPEFARGVIWYHWRGSYYSLKTTEMKIRPTPQ